MRIWIYEHEYETMKYFFVIDLHSPYEVFKLISPVPSRQTIGYIATTAGYRHISSHSSAIGHCSLVGWVELCKTCYLANIKGVVFLVRGHTQQYYIARGNLCNV